MLSRLFFILVILLTPQTSLSLSGCALCASRGNCGQAFHYGPGKYCGNFHDTFTSTRPCCCPNNSQCQVSSTQCNCYVNSSPSYNSGYHRGYDYNSYNYDTGAGVGGIITFLILICFCICCCRACASNSDNHDEGYVPVASPVNCDHEGNPPATAPGYQGSVPTARSTSSGNNQGFAWGPALGGFVLGQMFGGGGHHRHHRHHHHRHHGGGGGFIFGGDSGGGGNGFSFGGDSGGGGGGGFTIRGDS